MQIRNFNRTEATPVAASAATLLAAPGVAVANESIQTPLVRNEEQAHAEIALLRAKIEHLELVVETARNLMTSNQDRLLRRLHELPHEMIALTATLARYAPVSEREITPVAALRRVQ